VPGLRGASHDRLPALEGNPVNGGRKVRRVLAWSRP
jgi:hypothetical protein